MSAVRLTKAQLVEKLAWHRMRKYPALYTGGTYDDAVYFVMHHEGPSRAQLLLTAKCYGLVAEEVA